MTHMHKRNPNWSREELIIALDFYLQHGGSVPNKNSRAIAELQNRIVKAARQAGLSGDSKFRNRNGVYMKLMNFRRLDPKFRSGGGAGLSRGGKLEKLLWTELAEDAERCSRLATEID